jgi:hypothetical protein
MTVTALCLETGVFGETFAYELAAALGLQVLDLRPLELGIAEWHLFCHDTAECDDVGETTRRRKTASEIEERSVRIAAKLVARAQGNLLVVGWSAAAVLTPLSAVTRVCIRAPRPQLARSITRHFGYGFAATTPDRIEPRQWYLSRFANPTSDPKWLNVDDFDLVLDSGQISASACQREIVALLERRWNHQDVEDAPHGARLREPNHWSPAWRTLRGCAVSVGTDDVPLTGTDSQEDAIAKVERHLHGTNEMSPPANPLCRGASD